MLKLHNTYILKFSITVRTGISSQDFRIKAKKAGLFLAKESKQKQVFFTQNNTIQKILRNIPSYVPSVLI